MIQSLVHFFGPLELWRALGQSVLDNNQSLVIFKLSDIAGFQGASSLDPKTFGELFLNTIRKV